MFLSCWTKLTVSSLTYFRSACINLGWVSQEAGCLCLLCLVKTSVYGFGTKFLALTRRRRNHGADLRAWLDARNGNPHTDFYLFFIFLCLFFYECLCVCVCHVLAWPHAAHWERWSANHRCFCCTATL